MAFERFKVESGLVESSLLKKKPQKSCTDIYLAMTTVISAMAAISSTVIMRNRMPGHDNARNIRVYDRSRLNDGGYGYHRCAIHDCRHR